MRSTSWSFAALACGGLLLWWIRGSMPDVSAPTVRASIGGLPTAGDTRNVVALPVATPSPRPLDKTEIISEILESGNDNDPRIDRELRDLDFDTRLRLREKYRSLPLERRNARGMLIFLLGRELHSVEDFAFLKEVLSEKPCLGLANCSRPDSMSLSHPDDDHHDSGLELTLAYPQLVALHSLRRLLHDRDLTPERRALVRDVISVGERSMIPRVAEAARAM